MKIVVIGTRGIPDIMGGVESHCEELFPRIAAMGHDVTVIRRSAYVDRTPDLKEYKGVKLVDVYSPRSKSLEAVVHTFLAVIKARRLNPDILHIHAIGPSMMAPLARLLGMKVVMTNHGPDYDRNKWGFLAKNVLKFSERLGTMFSNKVIVISKVIANILKDKYGRTDTELIFNGVNRPTPTADRSYLRSLGIADDEKYILGMGRFVEEKGFHDLVEAYRKLGDRAKGYRLVLAGDADYKDEYSERLKQMVRDAGGILTGFIKGEKLHQVMSGASLYVMPSYHEGLPIALLEAMSYDLDIVVSDIPANKLDCIDPSFFFPTANVDALADKMAEKISQGTPRRTYDLSPFNWDTIAGQTVAVYEQMLKTNNQD